MAWLGLRGRRLADAHVAIVTLTAAHCVDKRIASHPAHVDGGTVQNIQQTQVYLEYDLHSALSVILAKPNENRCWRS